MPKYNVPRVAISTNSNVVSGVEPLPIPGVTYDATDRQIVFKVHTDARNAIEANESARETIRDILRVFGASYVGYRMLARHQDFVISRTDAIYVDGGEIPPFDSLDSSLTLAGANYFDPTGENRRHGKVFQLFVSGIGHHSIAGEIKRLEGRGRWEPSFKAAMDLYLEGQCTENLDIRFVLSMAALELLVNKSDQKVLDSHSWSESTSKKFF